jgi:hypothetical protein
MLSKHYLTLYVRLASLLLGGGRGYVIALGRTSILAYIPEILARVLVFEQALPGKFEENGFRRLDVFPLSLW